MSKLFRIFVLLALAAMLVPATSTVEAMDDAWWAKAGAPYKGVTLHGVTESTPPSTYAAKQVAQLFEQKTGIKVELELTSWDLQYDKAIKDMEAKTGVYDFVYIEQDIIYSYLYNHYLENLTAMMKAHPELVSPDFHLDDFTSFINYFKDPTVNNDLFGVPMEAFIKIYLYRPDLFADPAIRAAFNAKYGRDLAPATTHQEYTDIADFFTQWGKDHPTLFLWGTTVQAVTSHSASFYEMFESVLPTFGVYNWGINKDCKATTANGGSMDSDKAKAAFKWWTDLLKDAPPESTSSTWDEVAGTFAAGRAAQGLVYGENTGWIARDASRSIVTGKVAAALPPLEPGVLDDAKAGKGYVGYYDGGAFGMSVASKNKEATLLWLQFIGVKDIQADWALAGSRITLTSTYDDPKVKELDFITHGYFTMLKDQGYLFAGAPPFPFHAQIREVIAPFIWRGILGVTGGPGGLKTDDALDQAAKAVDAELAKLGFTTCGQIGD
jgi:multiple sugar transport system substrate-binding protein